MTRRNKSKGGFRGRTPKPRAAIAKNPRRRSSTTSKAATPKPSKIRILVADNHPMDRAGLVAMLRTEPDFDVVGEAADVDEAADRCRKSSPSIVILALRLPAPDGRSALPILRAEAPEVPVLAVAERGEGQCLVLNPPQSGRLTLNLSHAGANLGAAHGPGADNHSHDQCATGTDCLQLAVADGATGTIRRTAEPEELFRAIRIVASGKAWYEAGTASAIMRHALARTGQDGRTDLSDREMEVAELIANGRSNKEISQALDISEPTVKKHVGHILTKLKLQDRLQIGLYVARNPLVLRATRAKR